MEGAEPVAQRCTTGCPRADLDTKLIRKLDRYAGKPLCLSLTLFERVRRRVLPPGEGPPRKVLFVKLIEMGSTVLACPGFAEAERLVGRDNLYILVFASNRAIVDLLPYFKPENVLTIDDRSLGRFVLGLARVLARTRREGIDTAIDMEGLTRASAVITYLTGASRRVGFHNFSSEGPYRGRLFTTELGYTFQHHTAEMFLSLVRALGAPRGQVPKLKEVVEVDSEVMPRFEPTREDLEGMEALLQARADEGERSARLTMVTDATRRRGPRVILNPNCNDQLPLRKWPEPHFVELGRRLLAAREDLTVIITGNRSEREPSARMARAIGPAHRVVSVAGDTNLRQLLTLYHLADVLVSSDSGPCHFAALTPIHIVALFGPETSLLYSPVSERATTISAGMACSPCLNMLNHRLSYCTDNVCMRAIPVAQVLDATLSALEERGSLDEAAQVNVPAGRT